MAQPYPKTGSIDTIAMFIHPIKMFYRLRQPHSLYGEKMGWDEVGFKIVSYDFVELTNIPSRV